MEQFKCKQHTDRPRFGCPDCIKQRGRMYNPGTIEALRFEIMGLLNDLEYCQDLYDNRYDANEMDDNELLTQKIILHEQFSGKLEKLLNKYMG